MREGEYMILCAEHILGLQEVVNAKLAEGWVVVGGPVVVPVHDFIWKFYVYQALVRVAVDIDG